MRRVGGQMILVLGAGVATEVAVRPSTEAVELWRSDEYDEIEAYCGRAGVWPATRDAEARCMDGVCTTERA